MICFRNAPCQKPPVNLHSIHSKIKLSNTFNSQVSFPILAHNIRALPSPPPPTFPECVVLNTRTPLVPVEFFLSCSTDAERLVYLPSTQLVSLPIVFQFPHQMVMPAD